MASGPIFLAGVDRSGVGLLGELLEEHPQVSLTRRTNFWSYYAGRFGDLAVRANVDRAIDTMMENRRMHILEPDRVRLSTDLASSPTYPRLFELLQIQLMQRRGRTRWGDKSLGAERYAATILGAYETARMVHVLRDPRDRYASQKLHRGASRGGVGAGAALWNWSERLAGRNRRRFAGRYHVIRYEDLVSDPEAVLDRILDFFELDRSDSTVAAVSASRPLTGASVGRFRRDLSTGELGYLQLACRRGMARRGYQLEPVPFSVSTRLGFWLTRAPLETFNSARWRGSAALRAHRGKDPSARRLVGAPDRTPDKEPGRPSSRGRR